MFPLTTILKKKAKLNEEIENFKSRRKARN